MVFGCFPLVFTSGFGVGVFSWCSVISLGLFTVVLVFVRVFFFFCRSLRGQELETTVKTKKSNQNLILRDRLNRCSPPFFLVFAMVLVVVHGFRLIFSHFFHDVVSTLCCTYGWL